MSSRSSSPSLGAWLMSWLMPKRVFDTSTAKAAANESDKRARHVDELGKRIDEVADWWNDDVAANHYAQRIQAAYRAEATGNQNRIEE